MTTDGMVCGGGVVGSGGSGCMSGGCARGHQQLTWEKLSPEEFQQLQDFAACKSILVIILFPAFFRELSSRQLAILSTYKSAFSSLL